VAVAAAVVVVAGAAVDDVRAILGVVGIAARVTVVAAPPEGEFAPIEQPEPRH